MREAAFPVPAYVTDYLRISRELGRISEILDSPAFRAAERVTELYSTLEVPALRAVRASEQVAQIQLPAVTALYNVNRFAAAGDRATRDILRIAQQHSRKLAELNEALAPTRRLIDSVVQSLSYRSYAWANEIAEHVNRIDLGLASSALGASYGDTASFQERIRNAFSAIEFPDEILGGISSEALAEDIATEIDRASTELGGVGLGAAIAHVVSRLTGVTEGQRGYLFIILLCIAVTFLQESIGGIVEVEYDRWRNASEDAARQSEDYRQAELLERSHRELKLIAEQISNPPMAAEVIRRARLRAEPDTAAPTSRTLDPGTHLLVLERRDGWVRVEAEPIPGEVLQGWVYGRLTRYIR